MKLKSNIQSANRRPQFSKQDAPSLDRKNSDSVSHQMEFYKNPSKDSRGSLYSGTIEGTHSFAPLPKNKSMKGFRKQKPQSANLITQKL